MKLRLRFRIIAILVIFIQVNVLLAQVPNYVPTNGLIGYWPFNGNANDVSGNGYNLVNNNVTFGNDRNNVANAAAYFSGNSSQLTSQTAVSQFTSSPLQTYSFWFKNVSSNWRFIVNYANSATTRLSICPNTLAATKSIAVIGSNGCLNCGASGGGYDFNSPGLEIGWHHIAVSVSASTYSVFYDGNLLSTQPHTGFNCVDASFRLVFGNDIVCAPEFYEMFLDDIGIWNRALTPAEITGIYNTTPIGPTLSIAASPSTAACAGSPVTLTASTTSGASACQASALPSNLQTGLVAYWPFCGNANDASGNGNNGTVNGATLTADRFGNPNSAYSFTGSNQIVGSTNFYDNGWSSSTISLWFNTSSLSQQHQTLFNTIPHDGEAIIWNHSAAPNKICHWKNENTSVNSWNIFSPNALNYNNVQVNNWINISIVKNNMQYSYYVNGILDKVSISSISALNQLLAIRLGSIGTTEFFNGKLDDIAIYNRALTAAEVQQLYALNNTVPTYSWSPGGATTQSITVSPATNTTYSCTVTANSSSTTSTYTVNVLPAPSITATNNSVCAGNSTTLTATAGSTATPNTCANLTGSLATGLVGYWPFCGNANDVSGNNNNGTVNGTTLTTDRFGNANNAYSFNGSNSIDIGVNGVSTANNQATLSAWVYLTSIPGGVAYIVGYGNPSNLGGVFATGHYGGSGLFGTFSGSMFDAISNLNCPLNSWNLITTVKSSNGLVKIYLNGNLLYSQTVSTPNIGNISGRIGKAVWNSNENWNGKIDDVAIWNRELTTTEIQQLYTQGQTTYSWTPGGAITPSITVSPTSTTTYTCAVTNGNGTCSSDFVVTVNPLPSVNAGLDQTICAGTSATLNATGATTYSWSGGVQNGLAFIPTSSGTYTVTGTSAAGCTNQDDLVLNLTSLPSTTVTTNGSTSFCPGSSVQLCAPTGTGYTYSWSGSLATTSCITVSSSQTTSVTVTTPAGCSATSAPQQVVVFGNPVANAGPDVTITCVQNSSGAQIGATPNPSYTYLWSPATGLNSTTIANPIANPSVTTTYSLTVINADGCLGSDQVTVTVNNTPPTANAGLDFTKTCASNPTGATIGTTAIAGNTYAWTPTNGLSSASIANPTANPLFNTTYTLTATNTGNGCTATDQVLVTVNTFQPTANAGLDFTTTCISNVNGTNIGSTSVTGNTYAWTPTTGLSSATVSNPTANPTTTTTYTLTTTNTASGCTATDQVLVTVDNQGPTVNAGIDLSKTCVSNVNGATIGMTAIAGNSYTWTPASGLSSTTIANPFANPTVTTTYTVSSTNPTTGCTATDQIVVTVNNTPPTANAGLDATVSCNTNVGGAQLGTPTVAGNSYSWTPSTGLNSSTLSQPTANPSTNTTYNLMVMNASSGCMSTDQVDVTVNTTPATANAGPDGSVNCLNNGTGYGLGSTPIAGMTYAWTPSTGLSSATVANPLANPSVATVYTLTATNAASGCTATDQVTVFINTQVPSVDAGLNQIICAGTPVTLSGNGSVGATFQWNNGVQNGVAFVPTTTTTYTLTATAANGCSSTDQVIVSVNALPVVSAGPDINACDGSAVTLSGSGALSYTWQPAVQNGQPFIPVNSSAFIVTGTDANNCHQTDTVQVNVGQTTSSTLNESACDSYTLNGQTYTQSGTYTQVIPNGSGCDSTITLNLSMDFSPITPVITLTNGVTMTTPAQANVSFQWINCSDLTPIAGATGTTFTASMNGVYAVVASNGCGSDTSECSTINSVGITDLSGADLSVYPNPTDGALHVQVSANMLGQTWKLYDIRGRLVVDGNIETETSTLSMEQLSLGTYWLHLGSIQPVQVVKN